MVKTFNKIFTLSFVMFLFAFAIFAYPIKHNVYADETSVTSESLPDTFTWQRESDYSNGDIIFGKYFRFFYHDSFYINETVHTSPMLYIGRTEDAFLTISAVGEDNVVLVAVLLSSGEQRAYSLSANYNSTDNYVDFYIPTDLGKQFDFSAGYGYYESVKDDNDNYVLSTRIYQITANDNDIGGGSPGSSGKDKPIIDVSNISLKNVLSVLFVIILLVGVFSIIPKSTNKKSNYKYKKRQYKY